MNTQVFDICLERPQCLRKEVGAEKRYLLLKLCIHKLHCYAIYIESEKNGSDAALALLPAELTSPDAAFSLAVAHSLSPVHLCDWIEDLRRGLWMTE